MVVEKQALEQLEHNNAFTGRHIGPDTKEQQAMLNLLGAESVEALIKDTVPGLSTGSSP